MTRNTTGEMIARPTAASSAGQLAPQRADDERPAPMKQQAGPGVWCCTTQNLQGFRRDPKHRRRWMAAWRRRLLGVQQLAILVQETHVSSAQESSELKDTWRRSNGMSNDGVSSYWSVGPDRTQGVGIILNPHIHQTFAPVAQELWNPRFVAVASPTIQLVNVYAPNDATEREDFYRNLQQWQPDSNKLLIMGGDFNAVVDPVVDRVTPGPTRA